MFFSITVLCNNLWKLVWDVWKYVLVLANVEKTEIGLYEMLLVWFGMGTMLASSIHTCGMILVLRESVYSCVI